MREAAAYNLFKKHIERPGDRIERIENVVGFGTPDVSYCIEGVEGWIELKAPLEPAKDSTSLFSGNHKLNMDQCNWMLRQRNAGGRAYILIATDKRWLLVSKGHADQINKLNVGQMKEVACWWSDKPITTLCWERLRKVLTT